MTSAADGYLAYTHSPKCMMPLPVVSRARAEKLF